MQEYVVEYVSATFIPQSAWETEGVINANRKNAMITILENSNYSFCASSERQIGHGKGVRSGALRPSGGLFKKTRNNNLIKYFYSYFTSFELIKGIRFVAAEHTRNLILIKREILTNKTQSRICR